MKTIQSVTRYFPDQCGGIQVHLSELIPLLRTYGVESSIAAARTSFQEQTYQYNGIEVHRYPVVNKPKPEPNHGYLSQRGLERFVHWLRQQDAAVYHQHQWTPECGLPHLRAAKEEGMATVITVHLPVPICQRNTLMRHGREACDGFVDLVRCSQCCGVSDQLPAASVQLLGRLPMPVSQGARGLLRRSQHLFSPLRETLGSLLTPLTIPRFVAARRESLQEMAKFSDCIIAVSQWLYDALLLNGIPREKLVLCRCGVSATLEPSLAKPSSSRLRVGFLGRWNPNKGIHVLVDAMQALPPDVPIELIIHSIEDDREYQQHMLHRIGDDPRIQVAPFLSREELAATLVGFDVLAVPSQWLETGPLVVLEAHACGVPVLGSDLGGIAELIRHRVNGWLLPPDDPQAWSKTLLRLAENPLLLDRIRQGIRPVRSIGVEAMELATLYRSVLKQQSIYQIQEIGACSS